MESVSPTSLEYLLLGSVRESLPTPPLVYQYLEVKYSTQLLQRNAWPMGDAQSLLSEKMFYLSKSIQGYLTLE